MSEEKIKTLMLPGATNKFSIYGKEFWTIKDAQDYAIEVELTGTASCMQCGTAVKNDVVFCDSCVEELSEDL
jgi:hypothetical protein